MDIGENVEIINKQISKKKNFNKELLEDINSLDLEKKNFCEKKNFDVSSFYSKFLISYDLMDFDNIIHILMVFVFYENDLFIEKRIESIFFEILEKIIFYIDSKNFDCLNSLFRNFFIFLQVFLFLKKDLKKLFFGNKIIIDFDINILFQNIINVLLENVKMEKKLNFFMNINLENLKVFVSLEKLKLEKIENLLKKTTDDFIINLEKKKLESFFLKKINENLKNLTNRLENEKNIDIKEFQEFENIYILLKNNKNLNPEINLNRIKNIITEKKKKLTEEKIYEKFSVENIILEEMNFRKLFSEKNLNIFDNKISEEKENFSNFLIQFFENELNKLIAIKFKNEKQFYKINIMIFYFFLINISWKKLELENKINILGNLKNLMKKEVEIFSNELKNLDLKNELNLTIKSITEIEIFPDFIKEIKVILLNFLGFERFLPFDEKLNLLNKKDKIIYIKNREQYSFLFDCYILDIEAISQNLNITKLIQNFF